MLAYVGPMLAPCWPIVEPSWRLCGAYVGDMLAILGLCWGYVSVCWPHVGLCWPYVEPSWRPCWADVGDMLAILGLCWGYVRRFLLKKSSVTFFDDFSFPQSKNHGKTYVFRHRQDEILGRQGPQNPVKHSVFYTSHARYTVNYRGFC